MHPNARIQSFKVVVLEQILPKTSHGGYFTIDSTPSDATFEIPLSEKTFIIDSSWLSVQLSALKTLIRCCWQIVLDKLSSCWSYHCIFIWIFELIQKDIIVIKVTVIAPLSPPLRVYDVPFQLIGWTFDFNILRRMRLLIIVIGVQSYFTSTQIIDVDSQALKYDSSLVPRTHFLAKRWAIHILVSFMILSVLSERVYWDAIELVFPRALFIFGKNIVIFNIRAFTLAPFVQHYCLKAHITRCTGVSKRRSVP